MTAETKDEIFNLQSKAFFRLGSAQYETGDYENAIEAFKESINCTKKKSNAESKPDRLVVRRLAEAKQEHVKRKKRQRKKFKMAFASTTSPLAAASASPDSSSAPSSTNPNILPANHSKPAVLTDRSSANVEAANK
jgi:tetratricopeptide (TPR) repeat protein